MTTSVSTPRIRLTQAWYVIVLILVAISERTSMNAAAADLAGLVLIVVATLGRLWTSAYIAGYKDKSLVTAGPYSICRHPLYLFSLLGGCGVGIVTRSLTLLIATALVLGLLHWRAIRAEERFLREHHGEAFERYRQRVPTLLPNGRLFDTPAEMTVNARIYRKAYLDAATFFGLYILIHLLDIGRAAGLWPTLLRLW